MENKMEDADGLCNLVKGELAAVETYKQALEKVGPETAGSELRHLEEEHEEALRALRKQLASRNVAVPVDSGLWGEWSKAVEGAAAAFGDKAAIKALKEGEEHGIHGYEDALHNKSLDAGIRQLIGTQLLPKTREHIPVLDRLLAKAGR